MLCALAALIGGRVKRLARLRWLASPVQGHVPGKDKEYNPNCMIAAGGGTGLGGGPVARPLPDLLLLQPPLLGRCCRAAARSPAARRPSGSIQGHSKLLKQAS